MYLCGTHIQPRAADGALRHNYYPWSLDLFVHVPFSTPLGAYSTAAMQR